jgi:hypothetical protein
MLTRKHFEAIAKIVSANRDFARWQTKVNPDLAPEDAVNHTLDCIVNELGAIFKQENPNFKVEKFKDACK